MAHHKNLVERREVGFVDEGSHEIIQNFEGRNPCGLQRGGSTAFDPRIFSPEHGGIRMGLICNKMRSQNVYTIDQSSVLASPGHVTQVLDGIVLVSMNDDDPCSDF